MILERENESFAVWNVLFYGALKELVDLKELKDNQGKTDDYSKRQPKAWKVAKELLEMFDSEMLTTKNEFADQFQQMESEIQKEMEKFDMDKRLKAARAIEDLKNFVITC